MGLEASIRLPTRLMGVVRTDPASVSATPPPLSMATNLMPGIPDAPDPRKVQDEERARIHQVLADLSRATQHLRTTDARTALDIKNASVNLAVAVASHFLMEQVQAGTFPFERLIEKAVDRIASRQPVTVTLHPDDLALLQERLGEANALSTTADLRWSPDESLSRGSCKLETPDRSILFDMEDRFDQMKQTLLQIASD